MSGVPLGFELVPSWMYYVGIGVWFLLIVLLGVFIYVGFRTPMMTWLRSIFSRRPIFLMGGRDNIGGFFTPKTSDGVAYLKDKGAFKITEGSFIFDRKSKKPIYLAHEEIGATISYEWPRILEELRKLGFDVKNGKDYKNLVLEAGSNPKLDKNICLSTGKTIKISDLYQYFPLNLNPTFIKSYAENEKRQAQKRFESLKVLSFVGLAFVMICIGGYILLGRVSEMSTTCKCDCPGVVGVEGVKVSNGGGVSMPELDEPKSVSPGSGGVKGVGVS